MGLHVFSRSAALICALALGCVSCGDSQLRGSVEPSHDERTCLVVTGGNNCEQIKIDGSKWPHAIDESGSVGLGVHTIDCNGRIRFSIPAGKTFKFNYWGP